VQALERNPIPIAIAIAIAILADCFTPWVKTNRATTTLNIQQNQFKLHLAVTYVATAEGRILGFATVAGSSVERHRLPPPRLRRRLPDYPLPVLRLTLPA